MKRPLTLTVGLAICVLLGVFDIVGLLALGTDDAPPAPVIVIGAALSLITLVGASLALREERSGRSGLLAVVIARLLSVAMTIPVFFVDNVPDLAPLTGGIFIVLALAGVGLVGISLRQAPPSTAGS